MKPKSLFSCTLILAILLTTVAFSQNVTQLTPTPPLPIPPFSQEKLSTFLDTRVPELLAQTGIPGMAVAVVHRDKVIYAKGFGVRTVGTDLPVDANTVFQLASMSKSIASTVVAGTVGHGAVKWDDPIVKYLPKFKLANPEVSAKVTIADMFAHRSGLPDQAGDAREVLGCRRNEVIEQLRHEPLNPYRSSYVYSNFGLTTGAEAVAAAEKLSWEALSKKELYDPLRMASTSSSWADYYYRSNKADIHIKDKEGKWRVSTRNADALSPSGGVSSNVIDLAKWMMLQLNEGEYLGHALINREALRQTQQPHMLMRAATATTPAAHYGLGMNVGYDKTGRLRLSHSGAFPQGASTTFELLPSEQLGIVILSNGMPLGIPEIIAQEFVDMVEYGQVKHDWYTEISAMFNASFGNQDRSETARPTPLVPALPLSNYVATYTNEFYGQAIITARGSNLYLTLKPCTIASTYKLTHWDGNTFVFPFGNLTAPPMSKLEFSPAKGSQPATIQIEYLNASGLGTFIKIASVRGP